MRTYTDREVIGFAVFALALLAAWVVAVIAVVEWS